MHHSEGLPCFLKVVIYHYSMTNELYLAYTVTTAMLIVMPGPIVTLVLAKSLSHGTRTGVATAIGATTGTAVLLTLGASGMSWVLGTLSDWLLWIRWAGAAYLIFLGIRQWSSTFYTLRDNETKKGSIIMTMGHGFIIAITNPKTIIFFVAFFPQFIDPTNSINQQLFTMCLTFIFLALIIDGSYALLAGHLGKFLAETKYSHFCNRISSFILVFTGLGITVLHMV